MRGSLTRAQFANGLINERTGLFSMPFCKRARQRGAFDTKSSETVQNVTTRSGALHINTRSNRKAIHKGISPRKSRKKQSSTRVGFEILNRKPPLVASDREFLSFISFCGPFFLDALSVSIGLIISPYSCLKTFVCNVCISSKPLSHIMGFSPYASSE